MRVILTDALVVDEWLLATSCRLMPTGRVTGLAGSGGGRVETLLRPGLPVVVAATRLLTQENTFSSFEPTRDLGLCKQIWSLAIIITNDTPLGKWGIQFIIKVRSRRRHEMSADPGPYVTLIPFIPMTSVEHLCKHRKHRMSFLIAMLSKIQVANMRKSGLKLCEETWTFFMISTPKTSLQIIVILWSVLKVSEWALILVLILPLSHLSRCMYNTFLLPWYMYNIFYGLLHFVERHSSYLHLATKLKDMFLYFLYGF